MKKNKTTRKFAPLTEEVFNKFKALKEREKRTYSAQLEVLIDNYKHNK